MDIQEMDIDQIVAYPQNPRQIDGAAIKAVANSIREFGWRQPIVVDESGVIIIGHTRKLAAESLGYTTVPVHIAKGLSPARARALRLADNRTGDLTTWDVGLLGEELSGLIDEIELTNFGFSEGELTLVDIDEAAITAGGLMDHESETLLAEQMERRITPVVTIRFLRAEDVGPFLETLPENCSKKRINTNTSRGEEATEAWGVRIPRSSEWPE